MGKSPKPLNFQIDPACVQTPDDQAIVDGLIAQGHSIDLQPPGGLLCSNYSIDILLSPRAWRAFDLKYLDLAIKSARAVKYVKKSEVKLKKPRAARKKKGDPGPEPE